MAALPKIWERLIYIRRGATVNGVNINSGVRGDNKSERDLVARGGRRVGAKGMTRRNSGSKRRRGDAAAARSFTLYVFYRAFLWRLYMCFTMLCGSKFYARQYHSAIVSYNLFWKYWFGYTLGKRVHIIRKTCFNRALRFDVVSNNEAQCL